MLIWITGISASGKSTIAKKLYSDIKKKYKNTVYLDGDSFRELNNNDLKYTLKDRNTNALRLTRFCKFLIDQKINVICAANLTSQNIEIGVEKI